MIEAEDGTLMTRIKRIGADQIRDDPPDSRHQYAILLHNKFSI